MRVWLVRHGQANENGALTEEGQKQAAAIVALFFRSAPDLVIASRETATQETANPLLAKYELKAQVGPCYAREKDEDLVQLLARATKFLRWLEARSEEWVIVFSTDDFIRALSYLIRGLPFEDFFEGTFMPPGAMTGIAWDGTWKMVGLGLDLGAPPRPEDEEEDPEEASEQETEDEDGE